MSKLTEERKQQIWDEILANPGYSRNVNRSNLENIKIWMQLIRNV